MESELWLTHLKNNGYRLTESRKAVVETVAATTHALTPVEVYDRARVPCPGLGLVTVYRTLEKLEELGLIQRVHQMSGCQAFIASGNGHDHLLLCTNCGSAVHFSGDQLDCLIGSLAIRLHHREHWLQLFDCAKNARTAKK
jgi:Fe2+ or Zn2+ uptake regulation protein